MDVNTLKNSPGPCEICSSYEWSCIYEGPVRDGVFGSYVERAYVWRCGGCGVERLGEQFCIPDSYYETEEYRHKLKQEIAAEKFFELHDDLQIHNLRVVHPLGLRGAVLADIGCGGGSFLDHIGGLLEKAIAIEPCLLFHESLRRRGYEVYAYADDVYNGIHDSTGIVDLAVSFQVIEHVSNPLTFLQGIRSLMKRKGKLIVSTPNRHDVLMQLLPDLFPSFFYRVVHRWYFDEWSLSRCAEAAGFTVVGRQFVHRYGLSNTLAWLRDRKPTGQQKLPGIECSMDGAWIDYLEKNGSSDTVYVILQAGLK